VDAKVTDAADDYTVTLKEPSRDSEEVVGELNEGEGYATLVVREANTTNDPVPSTTMITGDVDTDDITKRVEDFGVALQVADKRLDANYSLEKNEQLNSVIGQLNGTLAQLNGTITQLNGTIVQLEFERDEQKRECRRLLGELAAAKEKGEQLNGTVEQLKRERDELSRRHDRTLGIEQGSFELLFRCFVIALAAIGGILWITCAPVRSVMDAAFKNNTSIIVPVSTFLVQDLPEMIRYQLFDNTIDLLAGLFCAVVIFFVCVNGQKLRKPLSDAIHKRATRDADSNKPEHTS
jgi:predicted RNase H-like nuclease (RuvC/YqgF family)